MPAGTLSYRELVPWHSSEKEPNYSQPQTSNKNANATLGRYTAERSRSYKQTIWKSSQRIQRIDSRRALQSAWQVGNSLR